MPRPSRLAFHFGHSAPIRALAYSPDRARLVTGDGVGQLMVWDVATAAGRLLRSPGIPPTRPWRGDRVCLRCTDAVEHVVWVDERVVAAAIDDHVVLYDVDTGALLHTLPDLRGGLAAEDGRLLAWAGAATLVRIHPRTGAAEARVALATMEVQAVRGDVSDVTWRDDGLYWTSHLDQLNEWGGRAMRVPGIALASRASASQDGRPSARSRFAPTG